MSYSPVLTHSAGLFSRLSGILSVNVIFPTFWTNLCLLLIFVPSGRGTIIYVYMDNKGIDWKQNPVELYCLGLSWSWWNLQKFYFAHFSTNPEKILMRCWNVWKHWNPIQIRFGTIDKIYWWNPIFPATNLHHLSHLLSWALQSKFRPSQSHARSDLTHDLFLCFVQTRVLLCSLCCLSQTSFPETRKISYAATLVFIVSM